MTTKSGRLYSNIAIPPGESLQEETEFRGISAQTLADSCGKSVDEIKDIFRGAKEITPEFAAALEQVVTGIGAYIWLGLEEDYQETLRRVGESRPE